MQNPIDMAMIILMIEQDQHQIDTTCAAIQEIWHDVLVHKIDTVDEAIDYMFRKGCGSETLPDPDLVILGALTPVIDAIHLVSVTRKSRKLERLPIVAMTIREQVNCRDFAQKLGVDLVVPQSQIEIQMRKISKIMVEYWFEG